MEVNRYDRELVILVVARHMDLRNTCTSLNCHANWRITQIHYYHDDRADEARSSSPGEPFRTPRLKIGASSRPRRSAEVMPADYLDGRALRRFAGTPLRLLGTGFVMSAVSNRRRMPCSSSATALSRAPSCPTLTIATDKGNANDGGRNTSIVPRNSFLAIKRAGSSPTPYPD